MKNQKEKKTRVIESPSLIEVADLMAKHALPPNTAVNACTRMVITLDA